MIILFSGDNTFSGTNTHSGTETYTGTLDISNATVTGRIGAGNLPQTPPSGWGTGTGGGGTRPTWTPSGTITRTADTNNMGTASGRINAVGNFTVALPAGRTIADYNGHRIKI